MLSMESYGIIHQEVLFAKLTGFANVMKVIMKKVNFNLPCALNHRQFPDHLAESSSYYNDLLYFCEVCWLTKGKMLQRKDVTKNFRPQRRDCNILKRKNLQPQSFEMLIGCQN